jgi:hypothetical protein
MTDQTLKNLFEETKHQDADNTPSFQRVLRKQAAPVTDSAAPGWMPFALAATLLVAALVAFSVLPKNESHATEEVDQWASISEWTASSDAILAENAPAIGVSFSTPSDVLFDSTPNSPETTKNQNL